MKKNIYLHNLSQQYNPSTSKIVRNNSSTTGGCRLSYWRRLQFFVVRCQLMPHILQRLFNPILRLSWPLNLPLTWWEAYGTHFPSFTTMSPSQTNLVCQVAKFDVSAYFSYVTESFCSCLYGKNHRLVGEQTCCRVVYWGSNIINVVLKDSRYLGASTVPSIICSWPTTWRDIHHQIMNQAGNLTLGTL